MTDIDDARPSDELIETFGPTLARLKGLYETIKPMALRRADKLPSHATLLLAHSALQDVVRLTSRLGGPALLPLWRDDYAGLAVRLGQAHAMLMLLRARYCADNDPDGEDIWYTREFVAAEAAARAYALAHGEPWPPAPDNSDDDDEGDYDLDDYRAYRDLPAHKRIYPHAW